MSEPRKVVAGALFWAVAWACGAAAQTSKNPISTKPEGTTPNCSYSGSVTNGKATSNSACTPSPTPGTDPNQIAPIPATKRFPYPGETPVVPASSASQADAAASPTTQTGAPSAAKRFPFPGESTTSDSPEGVPGSSTRQGTPGPGSADKPGPGVSPSSPLQDAGSSGSSSSSSGSSSSSQADPGFSSSKAGPDLPDDDANAPMPTPKHHTDRKKLPPPEKPLSQEEKVADDIQVAGFYQNDGNFTAAYARAKEAVSLAVDDADAHLALAEAARKLGKLDEAETNYKKVLALDPVPKVRKVAEKALKEMSGA